MIRSASPSRSSARRSSFASRSASSTATRSFIRPPVPFSLGHYAGGRTAKRGRGLGGLTAATAGDVNPTVGHLCATRPAYA